MNKFDTQVKKLLAENSKEQPVMTVDEQGVKRWYLNGKRHREDGPAVEFPDGSKIWYINDKRHREDGPAVETPNGYKVWYLNDNRHREDGPAIEYGSRNKKWYLNNEELTEDQWRIRVNVKKNVSPEHQQNVLDILDL